MVLKAEREVAGYSYQPTPTELLAEGFSESLGVELRPSGTRADFVLWGLTRHSTLGKSGSTALFIISYDRDLQIPKLPDIPDGEYPPLPDKVITNIASDETRRKMLLDPSSFSECIERLEETILMRVYDSSNTALTRDQINSLFDSDTPSTQAVLSAIHFEKRSKFIDENRVLTLSYQRPSVFLEDGKRNTHHYYTDRLGIASRLFSREGEKIVFDGALPEEWFNQINKGSDSMLIPVSRAQYEFPVGMADPLVVTGLMRKYLEDFTAKLI